MNILVLGKGGREHALVRAVKSSSPVKEVFVLPGREGFSSFGVCLSRDYLNKEKLRQFIKEKTIDLVVIGPELELVEGWSDFFRSLGISVFGPSQAAARLESSKIFAKQFMGSTGVTTSAFEEVCSVKEALFTLNRFSFPVVLKADGLAGGKGVFICHNRKEFEEAAISLFDKKIFGKSGEKALVEPFLTGWELSVFILTNGREFELLPLARDYKQRYDVHQGPNTGGMGAFAPHFVSNELMQKIQDQVIRPTVKGIEKNNLFYRGVLYMGLMITKEGPFVLEYNVRFGDPEAQVLLPLLEGDWAEVFYQVADGKVPSLRWKNLFATCVVLVDEGYPEVIKKGTGIKGDTHFSSNNSYFLHSGTKKVGEKWVTDGGRVLNAIGIGKSKEESIRRAYAQCAHVQWSGCAQRSDIGQE